MSRTTEVEEAKKELGTEHWLVDCISQHRVKQPPHDKEIEFLVQYKGYDRDGDRWARCMDH
jgi:hypothetical protein